MPSPNSTTLLEHWCSQRPKITRVLAGGWVVVLTASVFWPQMFDGATFPWDFQGKYTTGPAHVSAALSQGIVPTWVSNVGAGMPIFEDPGSGVYYPLWWITGVLSIPLTYNLMAQIQVLHVILGGVGMIAFLRSRQHPWVWSVGGATAFVLCGIFFSQSQHANFIRGFAMFPWFLWAVTPRLDDRPWIRLIAVPPLVYIAAAGIYPGQLASFPLMIGMYLVLSIYLRPDLRRRRTALLLAVAAMAALVAVALVWGPFFSGLGAQLGRESPPTAAGRAAASFQAADLLGSFLNPWYQEGDQSSMAWTLSLPVLVGLVGVGRFTLRKSAPVAAMGFVAIVLGTVASWPPAGRIMLNLGPVFTSRFSFADYKIGVVVTLIVLGIAGWQQILLKPQQHLKRVVGAGVAAVVVMWLASDLQVTDATGYEAVIALVAIALAVLVFLAPQGHVTIAAMLIVALFVVDGVRAVADQRFHIEGTSPWIARPPAEYVVQRDTAVRNLPNILASPPVTRPARLPPAVDPAERPGGTPAEALGYLGMGYRLQRHGGLATHSLDTILADDELTQVMLTEWTPWVVSCSETDCENLAALPPMDQWVRTDDIKTASYGQDEIEYDVELDERVLFIENEARHEFWSSDDPRVTPVRHDGGLRAWILEPGAYSFTSEYRTSALGRSLLLGLVLLLLWAGLAVGILRSKPCSRTMGDTDVDKRNAGKRPKAVTAPTAK